jgi:hypothetical protein
MIAARNTLPALIAMAMGHLLIYEVEILGYGAYGSASVLELM